MITEVDVRKIFKGLEQGDGAGFFEHVDDKVDWIVEGTHPLAGHYKSKSDFVAGTFAKLARFYLAELNSPSSICSSRTIRRS
jgi:uncharacterized protein